MIDSEPISFFHLGYNIESHASTLRQATLEELREWVFSDNPELYGAIVVTGLGAGELIVEDELPPLVWHLCFQALMALDRGESYQWHIFSYPSQAEVRAEGEHVSILLNDRVLGTFPTRPLVKALWEVGQRFVYMYVSVLATNPESAPAGDQLVEGRDDARDAVARLLAST